MKTLDQRRVDIVIEGARQIAGTADLLLASGAADDSEQAPALRSALLRMQETVCVILQAFDETDDEIDEMERTMFGAVQASEEEATA